MCSLDAGPVGVIPACVMVLIPALIWLVYFYIQDSYEPEPTHLVLGVFLLGTLVAAPIARWLIQDVYRVAEWGTLKRWSGEQLVASFLVVGAAQELMKYV